MVRYSLEKIFRLLFPHALGKSFGFRKALRFPRAGVPLRLSGAVRASHAGSKDSYVFARKVTVQGARPQPFLVPAAQKVVSGTRIKAILIDAWNKAG